jgi:uncharacterized protein with PQ loop repeat
VVASLTQLFTWAPQIAHTLRTRDLGSLSVAQLCIQFPGGAYHTLFMMSSKIFSTSSFLS